MTITRVGGLSSCSFWTNLFFLVVLCITMMMMGGNYVVNLSV